MSVCSSGIGSSSLNSSGSQMNDKHVNMKQFISIALEYNRTRSEACANQLNRHLQIIGVAIDLSTFDPHSSVVTEFYVSLHELMSSLESRSTLLWGGVNVLQQACRNRAAHHALIHTYNFLPILSRLLGDQLTRDKKVRLLTLIQELTYGIRITWQEPHIPHLIATMVKWITTGENNVVNLSLGILINLCYKNLPALYTLMRCVDTKAFMRTVMSLEVQNIDIQICKLLIILENINGQVPTKDILKFLSVAFETIAEALKNRDVVLLRHIVDFFIDVKGQYNQRTAFAEFKNYSQHIEKLISIVNNGGSESGDRNINNDPECITMLFEFLLALVQLNLPEIIPLHPSIAQLTLGWIQTEHVSAKALALLRSVATAQGVDTEQILQPLADGLQVLLVALNTGCSSDNDSALQTVDYQARLTALLHLLREMTKCPSLRIHVLQGLKRESIMTIFSPLTQTVFSPRNRDRDIFSEDAVVMYINALALVRELAPLDKTWQTFYIHLLEQKQIHLVIAHAFYKGSADIKSLVFEIVKTYEFQTDQIAQTFIEVQPLLDYGASNATSTTNCVDQPVPYTIMSLEQEDKLDNLIFKLQDAVQRNQLANIATSDVMELFEYKMAAMGHAERAAQISLEAASKQATHLKHRLAQMSAESSRLHQMLFHAQQCQEGTTAKLNSVEENMRQTVVRLAKAKTQCSEFENQLKASQAQLQIKNNEIRASEEKYQNLTAKYTTAQNQLSQMEGQVEEYSKKNTELCTVAKKMEEKIKDLDKKLEEKKTVLTKANQKITKLTDDVTNYENLCKRNEEQLMQKDKDYLEIQTELEDYKKKLDWIVQISMNKVNKTQT